MARRLRAHLDRAQDRRADDAKTRRILRSTRDRVRDAFEVPKHTRALALDSDISGHEDLDRAEDRLDMELGDPSGKSHIPQVDDQAPEDRLGAGARSEPPAAPALDAAADRPG